MDKVATAVVILWFVIGMAGAILRNERGYWRALMFGAMGPLALRNLAATCEAEEDR
jgi:hypothetical protein